MPLVATLIADPANSRLTPRLAKAAAASLGTGEPDWLAPGIACDLKLPTETGPDVAERRLRDVLRDEPVDIAIQPQAGRRKKMLIADMDSTMIDQECIDELADAIGVKDRVVDITSRAMNGEIDFEPALRARVALLKGLPVERIADVIATRISLAPGGHELVATMKRHDGYTALVSGGFTAFTGPIAARLGFDENRANRLIERDGRLTGAVAEPILGRKAKVSTLVDIARRLGLTPADAIAVGDGANDLDMLALAGTGVAMRAKPVVAAAARHRIDHGDLTALLYMQGYRREEFAA